MRTSPWHCRQRLLRPSTPINGFKYAVLFLQLPTQPHNIASSVLYHSYRHLNFPLRIRRSKNIRFPCYVSAIFLSLIHSSCVFLHFQTHTLFNPSLVRPSMFFLGSETGADQEYIV